MFSETHTFLLAVLLSLLCGTGVFLHGVREGRIKANFLNLLTEWVLSLIAGLTGYYIALHEDWNDSLIFIIVIIAANNWREFSEVMQGKMFSIVEAVIGKGGGSRKERDVRKGDDDDDRKH